MNDDDDVLKLSAVALCKNDDAAVVVVVAVSFALLLPHQSIKENDDEVDAAAVIKIVSMIDLSFFKLI